MNKKKIDETIIWSFGIIIFMIVAYLVQIQVWRVTSNDYKPANFLDLEVKTPLDKDEWLIRREHGICPFDTNEFNPKDPLKGFKNC